MNLKVCRLNLKAANVIFIQFNFTLVTSKFKFGVDQPVGKLDQLVAVQHAAINNHKKGRNAELPRMVTLSKEQNAEQIREY
jgi:hypothetical protein